MGKVIHISETVAIDIEDGFVRIGRKKFGGQGEWQEVIISVENLKKIAEEIAKEA